MSPITREARDRIETYLRLHTTPNDPPPPLGIRSLLDDLIAAVRGEQPEDHEF